MRDEREAAAATNPVHGVLQVREGRFRLHRIVGDPEREEQWGTGAIPGDAILGTSRAAGVANAIDAVTVAHDAGGASTLLFKSYEQGRGKWQGDTLNGVWFDEEPPMDIYIEGLTRTNATGGFAMMTVTPLKGMSEVVRLFLEDEAGG